MTDSARFSWTVLLPVKVLARAKSRLAVLAGPRRAELALALAADTVAAVVACREVARVMAVTSDAVVARELTALGAHVIHDVTDQADGLVTGLADGYDGALGGPGREDGQLDALGVQDRLNAALRHGAAAAARRWPGTGLVALTADLPALKPEELAAALRAAASAGSPASASDPVFAGPVFAGTAFVADAAAVGTTLYAAVPLAEFLPLYGGASRARHAAAGAVELRLDSVPGLRRDVDTPADLRAALALGTGPRTAALAAVLLADALNVDHRVKC